MPAKAPRDLVHFLPEEREAPLDPERSLLDHARAAGVALAAPCAGSGRCGKCRVVVTGPSSGGDDHALLTSSEVARGIRLACRCKPGAGVTVEVPESSRPARLASFLDGKETEGRGPFEPRPPRPGGGRPLGVALDLGTSTLAGILLDLAGGGVLATASSDNLQMPLGEDIISRILHAEESPGGLFRLQELLLKGADEVISSLLRQARAENGKVKEVVAAGNTVISCLLHGLDPSPIRRPPHQAPTLSFPDLRGAELGSASARDAVWRTFPALGGFVGGDVVAGLLASGLSRNVENTLFFDVGTNGEVVLGSRDFVIACSSSAGPAFEGGEVRCGMRAFPGAIDSIRIDAKTFGVDWTVLGGVRPMGICGSGILDLAAEMFRSDLLDRAGRFVSWPGVSFRETDRGRAFVVVEAGRSGTGEEIVIAEPDVKSILRTKAALCAAGETLMAAVGVSREAVRKVFIAGGFGNFLDMRSALRLGVFPPFPARRFVPLGNASLAGALAMLRAPSRWREAESLARAATYHDLASDPRFMEIYQRSLFIPHTDAEAYYAALAEDG